MSTCYRMLTTVAPNSKQAKMVYVASLNDQVVPIYSGLFTAASHPRILRALYIDGDAYQYASTIARCRGAELMFVMQFF